MSENTKPKKGIKVIVVIGIVAAVLIAAAVGVLFYGYSLASCEGVAQGVYVGSLDVSGKKNIASEVETALALSPDDEIGFVCDDVSFKLSVAQMGLEVNADAAVADAESYAKEGGFFKRSAEALGAKLAGKVFVPDYKCDKEALMAAIEANLQDKIVPVTPYSVAVGEDKLTVTNGVGGFGISDDDVSSKIIDSICSGNTDDIVLTLTGLDPEPVDFEEFCTTYIRQPQDATCTEQNGSYSFTEEVYGVDFDKEQARSIIEANRQSSDPYDIPCFVTAPEVTVLDLRIKYSTDCLASYSTSYASSDAGRAANVELAARKINGVVLNPGDRFSYNNIVGPRTLAAGFKIAHVYEGDRVVDGVGGGICQVSSTLYNTVLLADLKIVSRTNHSMPVAYVPLGRDATVSWGTIDFVFENDKKYPVKIVATYANRNLTISAYGVKEDDTVVEIATEHVSTVPYSTNETVDNSLKPGETKVTKEGSNGLVYNTYKVYKKNGEVIDRKHTSKSTYIPVSRQVSVGPAAPAQDNTTSYAPVNNEPVDYHKYNTRVETPVQDIQVPDVPVAAYPTDEAPQE